MTGNRAVTELLVAWRNGESNALNELTPLVYAELHQQASHLFRHERANHTLQPTALVNEAFVRLSDAQVQWQDRAHFFALAARTMRRVLVDHATARVALKRGGGDVQLTLDENLLAGDSLDLDLLDLESALSALAGLDERKAELMEMKLFGGLSYEEMSEVTALSTSTIDREIRFSKAWLTARLAAP